MAVGWLQTGPVRRLQTGPSALHSHCTAISRPQATCRPLATCCTSPCRRPWRSCAAASSWPSTACLRACWSRWVGGSVAGARPPPAAVRRGAGPPANLRCTPGPHAAQQRRGWGGQLRAALQRWHAEPTCCLRASFFSCFLLFSCQVSDLFVIWRPWAAYICPYFHTINVWVEATFYGQATACGDREPVQVGPRARGAALLGGLRGAMHRSGCGCGSGRRGGRRARSEGLLKSCQVTARSPPCRSLVAQMCPPTGTYAVAALGYGQMDASYSLLILLAFYLLQASAARPGRVPSAAQQRSSAAAEHAQSAACRGARSAGACRRRLPGAAPPDHRRPAPSCCPPCSGRRCTARCAGAWPTSAPPRRSPQRRRPPSRCAAPCLPAQLLGACMWFTLRAPSPPLPPLPLQIPLHRACSDKIPEGSEEGEEPPAAGAA